MKKKNKRILTYWITLFVGITAAFFIWLTWSKLRDFLGNSNLVWAITGGIVLIAILFGFFSFKKIADKFT